MRHELKDLIGKTVIFKGYLELWSCYDNYTDLLLTKVSVRGYYKPPRCLKVVDHLWYRLPAISSLEETEQLSKFTRSQIFVGKDKLERLSLFRGIGSIIEYQRKDNSKDYGIKPQWSVLFEPLLEMLFLLRKDVEVTKSLTKALASALISREIIIEIITLINQQKLICLDLDLINLKEENEKLLTEMTEFISNCLKIKFDKYDRININKLDSAVVRKVVKLRKRFSRLESTPKSKKGFG